MDIWVIRTPNHLFTQIKSNYIFKKNKAVNPFFVIGLFCTHHSAFITLYR